MKLSEEQKKALKSATVTFIKAIIPSLIAFLSAIVTTLLSGGDTTTGAIVGALAGGGCSMLV